LIHCRNEYEATAVKAALQVRLAECHLELHPTKTKIVYCKDGNRKGTYPNVKFDFLGYGFRPRLVKSVRYNKLFCGFTPAVSIPALKAMRETIRELNIRGQTQLSLADIAHRINPLLRGWIDYYGRRSLGAAPTAALRQSDAGGMGDAEVQTLCRSQGACEPVSNQDGRRSCTSLCTLASGSDRYVHLMGAG
jgi:hypothetical protein